MAEDFDTILSQIGTGKWNIFFYVTLGYWFSNCAYHALSSAFQTPEVAFYCVVPNDTQSFPQVSVHGTLTTDDNSTIYEPLTSGNQTSACSFKVYNATTGEEETEKCYVWEYDNTPYTSTATAEFDLVCDRNFLRATYQSVYMFGVFVGAGINGYMADRFGRRMMVMVGTISYSLIGLTISFIPNFMMILAARFLLGTMHPTSLITGYVLIMEVTDPKRRPPVGMFIFITWSFGNMLLGGWGYFIRDWRWLQLAISLPCFIFLPTLWFLDESPRWLAIVGRHEEAQAVLEKAARWNGVKAPDKENLHIIFRAVQEELGHNKDQTKKENDSSWKSKLSQWFKVATILFRTPILRKVTLIMYVDFFVVAMVYFGLSLGGGSFKVDPFLYMVISGLVEVPSHTVTIPIVTWFGRRGPLIGFYLLTGATMLIQPFIPDDYNWIAVTLVMIGKMSISTVFQIVGLYATELFPTEVRNRGLGTSMMSSRLGAIVAPYLMGLIGVYHPWITPVTFGIASILAGLVSMALRETTGSRLPDTVAHLEGYINPTFTPDQGSVISM